MDPNRMQQQTFGFDASEPSKQESEPMAASLPPSAQESEQVATEASLPPPLVRPDRQIVYPDADSHYDWPSAKELHDRDTMTADRTGCDIDGPPHRFVIKRGDTVELFRSRARTELGVVTGISHKNRQVRVLVPEHLEFDKRAEGSWCFLVEIFPTSEPEPIFSGRPLTEYLQSPTPVDSKNPSSAPAPTPYTFAEFEQLWKSRRDGTLSFSDYHQAFEQIVASQDFLTEELCTNHNAKELKSLAARMGDLYAKSNTKKTNAESIYRKMLAFFLLDGTVSFGMGESYLDAVIAKVNAVTQGDWDTHFENEAVKQRQHQEALANPKTLTDYNALVREKGEDALTDEQLATLDTLYAHITRENRKNATPDRVTQFESDELSGYEFRIIEGYHKKRECELSIVQLESRVERSTFHELKTKAKMLGGWYSSFVKSQAGFQFFERDTAERFIALLSGDADRTDVLASRKERKEQTTAERLHELASAMTAKADEAIEASNDSLQNTARRAGIQAGVRGQAYADQALARSMHSVAEALSRGDAKYLDGVRHKTHLETLDRVLSLARWTRIRTIRKAKEDHEYGYGLRVQEEEERPIGDHDIRFVEYPYPSVYKRHLEEAIAICRTKKGAKMASDRMAKRIRRESEDYITFSTESDIAQLADYLGRAKVAGYDTEPMERSMERFKRLQKANIHNIRELRPALREYLPHRAESRGDSPVQVAERELIGKKLPGFFPTPRPVIQQMLELADISEHDLVLEPSCGKGDIVTALREEYPNLSITALEMNRTLADVLEAKSIDVEFGDFLEHDGRYDRIVMNPPFAKGQDMDHVRHAYNCLAPGGKLVSVMSEGSFFRSDKQATDFQRWYGSLGGTSIKLPENAFQGMEAFRETGVRIRLVAMPFKGENEND